MPKTPWSVDRNANGVFCNAFSHFKSKTFTTMLHNIPERVVLGQLKQHLSVERRSLLPQKKNIDLSFHFD